MKNKILDYLYNKNKQYFEEKIISELMLKTPPIVEEPALDFLSQGKERLEKWLLYQSYYLQRKSVADVNNAQFFQGAMLYISIFLKVINQRKAVKTTEVKKVVDDREIKSLDAISELKNKLNPK